MDRMVDLNEKSRASVTIELGGKSFKIERVVTGVRQLYGRHVTTAGQLLVKVGQLNERIQAVKSATAEEQKKAEDAVEENTAEVEKFASEKLDILLRCIELLLVKNGYEFDRQWWIENGDDKDYQDFIVEAFKKDSAGQKKTAAADG